MDKRPKKPSSYDMLKRLDKKVQLNKTQTKDDSYSRNSSDYRKRRSVSPRSQESKKRRSVSPRKQDHDRKPSKRIPEIVIDDTNYDEPDRSFGDLYCKACDSHMNSEQMWEAHIQGKRHQKHIKKGGGDQGELKYEILDEAPLILPEIKKSTEPIIGLQHCCEIRRPEGKPLYQCFLCSANVPNGHTLIEHVVGLKHRMAYLKEHDPVKHDLIDKTNLKKGMIEPVVAECIRLHQDKHGTGIMQVKLDRTKPSVTWSKDNKKPGQDVFDNNLKRDDRDRRNSYLAERNEDYRYNKLQDYQRPRHFSDDPFGERYSYDSGHYPEPVSRYNRGESPIGGRRSPMAYERGYTYPTASNQPTVTNHPRHEGGGDCQLWPSLDPTMKPWLSQTTESPRSDVLEQRRVHDRTQSNSSNSNLFQSLMKIIETMPSMLFLELVLHRVESMDPTEAELSMLQKIGNHMISIVMNRKLQKLSPDLLGKYQSNPKPECFPVEEQSNKNTNNLNSLMNLVSQFNNTKASSSSSFNWGNQDSQLDNPSANVPAFMTQTTGLFYNSWGSSSNAVTEIPGLTLSSTIEPATYPQRTHDPEFPPRKDSSWSDSSFRNTYDDF